MTTPTSDKDKDKQPANVADSATKSPEQTAKQSNPLTAAEAPVKLNHGEETDAAKQRREEAEKTASDPFGDTPLQMRDVHDPAVDPAKVGTIRGGVEQSLRSQRLDPMAPSDPDASPDQPTKGGTTAPA